MEETMCPLVNAAEFRSAGLFALEEPFPLPLEGAYWLRPLQPESRLFERQVMEPMTPSWSSDTAARCEWQLFVFEAVGCQSCELQWESIRDFKREEYGSQRHLKFVSVVGADRLNTRISDALGAQSGAVVVLDAGGHLEEQLAVQATPFVALVDPSGFVRAYYPGYVDVAAPGFEVFSHRLSETSASSTATGEGRTTADSRAFSVPDLLVIVLALLGAALLVVAARAAWRAVVRFR